MKSVQKIYITILVSCLMCSLLQPVEGKVKTLSGKVVSEEGSYKIEAAKNIHASFSGAPAKSDVWIGLYEENADFSKPIKWQFTKSQTDGKLLFEAPIKPGTYIFKMYLHTITSGISELLDCSHPFTASWGPVTMQASLEPTKDGKSKQFKVVYSGAPGFIDDSIAMYRVNEEKRITYQWSKGLKAGTVFFGLPKEPGYYHFQLWGNNWRVNLQTSNPVHSVTGSTNPTSNKQIRIQLTIGSKTAYLNGAKKTLDVPPMIIEGRTLVPLRFITESFGCDVGWDAVTRTITIQFSIE